METAIHFTTERIVPARPRWPSREIGACLEFQGIVRELENGATLRGLFYEAYEPMARRRLEYHLAELATLHRCTVVEFTHRLGWVSVGEVSLHIRVLSAHRGEALALIGALIDRLKQDVPIWKLLAAPDGSKNSTFRSGESPTS